MQLLHPVEDMEEGHECGEHMGHVDTHDGISTATEYLYCCIGDHAGGITTTTTCLQHTHICSETCQGIGCIPIHHGGGDGDGTNRRPGHKIHNNIGSERCSFDAVARELQCLLIKQQA